MPGFFINIDTKDNIYITGKSRLSITQHRLSANYHIGKVSVVKAGAYSR